MTGFDHLSRIDAVIIMDDTGNLIMSHYFTDWCSDVKDQKKFEDEVFVQWGESSSSELSIFELDGMLVSYSRLTDCSMFIVAKNTANELIMDLVQENIYCALDLIFNGKISKNVIKEQIERMCMLLDEMFEFGFIVEISPEIIAARVMLVDDNTFLSNH